MTENHDMSAPEMTRVTVRVPKTTLDQIGQWVDSLGVRRSHFLGIALVAGSRSLMRICSPETFAVPGQARAADEGILVPGQRVGWESGDAPRGESLQGVQEMLRSAVSEMQAETAALRAEVLGVQERLSHPEKPKKVRP